MVIVAVLPARYLAAMSEKATDVLRSWVATFNRADVEGLVDLYHEDGVSHQVMDEPVVGWAAIRSMFARGFRAAAMTCMAENFYEDGELAIMEWRDPLGLRGCGFFQIQGGKIVLQRGYWDKLTFLKQHGLPVPE
jgi:ketosteroid isomerase-like protein